MALWWYVSKDHPLNRLYKRSFWTFKQHVCLCNLIVVLAAHIMSLTARKPTMTMYCNVTTVSSCLNDLFSVIFDTSGWFWAAHGPLTAFIVRNKLQVNWIQHLPETSIHLSDAFTQNVCFHHDKTKQKIHIFFIWSHHSPNWLNLSTLFSFPPETERLHILNLSVHLDCKEGESCLSSFFEWYEADDMSVKSAASL